jgi:hypothetical protein
MRFVFPWTFAIIVHPVGPFGNEAYPVNVVEFHPTKPHVFALAGGLGSFAFFEKEAKIRLKDHDYGDGDYARY